MNKLTADKCREQFEEWMTSLPGFEKADVERRQDGRYHYSETEWCWKSWQASRDALPILEQQERVEWIKCSERKPDAEGKYLTSGSYGVGTSWFHNTWGGRWLFHDCDTNNDEGMDGFTVTHWQPLPSPPEDV